MTFNRNLSLPHMFSTLQNPSLKNSMILVVSLLGILGGHQLLKIVQLLNSVDYVSVSIGAIADVHDPHSTQESSFLSPFSAANAGKVKSKTQTNPPSLDQCLSFDFNETLDTMVSRAKLIFTAMPPKGAGMSLHHFTTDCMKSNFIGAMLGSWTTNKTHKKQLYSTKDNGGRMPSLISSHLRSDDPLIDLIQHATRDTLIVYSHREETERLISAVKHVVTSRVCSKSLKAVDSLGYDRPVTEVFQMHRNKTHCIIDERPTIDLIQNRTREIGGGAQDILTCGLYDAIEQHAPNMIFMHFRQVSKLEKLIAKHHCPEMSERGPMKAYNVAQDKPMQVFLRLEGTTDDHIMELEDWLEERSALLEWALKLEKRNAASCQGKTRHMEYELFSCPDETIMVSGREYW